MATIKLLVNREARVADVDPQTPLLWVLRDELGLTGTKYGCGKGLCGSCTVLIDGEPARACVTPVGETRERRVTTIEGLSADGAHAVQKAWIDAQVAQCGWCQPGQLLAAAALLANHPDPTDAEIDRALQGNLCRCGTYPRIRRAIHAASKEARR